MGKIGSRVWETWDWDGRASGLLLGFTAALSLLVFCFITAVALLSFSDAYEFSSFNRAGTSSLRADSGVIYLLSSRDNPADAYWQVQVLSLDTAKAHWQPYAAPKNKPSGRFGFSSRTGRTGRGAFTILSIPAWVVLPPWAILPAVWLRRWRDKRRRTRAGACPQCGYNLRGSRTRCSECGWVMPYEQSLRHAMCQDAGQGTTVRRYGRPIARDP